MWDFNNDDGSDEEQPPTGAAPTPPPVVDVKPLAERVPTPGAWPGQPIDVSDDSEGMHTPGTSMPGGKRKRAEQVNHPQYTPVRVRCPYAATLTAARTRTSTGSLIFPRRTDLHYHGEQRSVRRGSQCA
jgi:hypothetical protein